MLAQAWPPGQEVLGSSSAPGDAVNTHKNLLQVLLLSSPQPSWPAGGGTRRVCNKGFYFSLFRAHLVEQWAELAVLHAKVWEERRGEREVS